MNAQDVNVNRFVTQVVKVLSWTPTLVMVVVKVLSWTPNLVMRGVCLFNHLMSGLNNFKEIYCGSQYSFGGCVHLFLNTTKTTDADRGDSNVGSKVIDIGGHTAVVIEQKEYNIVAAHFAYPNSSSHSPGASQCLVRNEEEYCAVVGNTTDITTEEP